MGSGEEIDRVQEEHNLAEAERRRFVYKDLESVLYRGFISFSTQWEGVSLSFRTPGRVAQDLLIDRVEEGSKSWKIWLVSTYLRSVDGFLIDEDRNSPWLVSKIWADKLLNVELDVLCSVCFGLKKRMDRCYKLLEAYCHEPYSRYNWRIGTRPKGDTYVGQVWTSINKIEDDLDEDMRNWTHTRAVVGAMSGKAAKALARSEEKYVKSRKLSAQRTIEKAINEVLFGEVTPPEPEYIEIGGEKVLMPTISPQSLESLEAEMARDMRGEKDLHDILVEDYKARARKHMEDAKRAREEARERSIELSQEDSGTIKAYTPEQMEQLGIQKANKPTSVQSTSEVDHRFRDYLDTEVRIGWIGLKGIPEEANKPVEKSSSLQDRLNKRKPTME
jgi:hypothetical protein